VAETFGEAAAQGVLALTLNKRLPKAEQMPECLGRIRQQPREIWRVKLADRITNLQPPPRHWSKGRIRDYHQEAQVIHAALQDSLPGRTGLKLREYAVFVV
jgi:(p)ppGpp synthase/HD superfamily hydrolase